MTRPSLLLLSALCALVGVLLVRVVMWSDRDRSGLLHRDVYPAPSLTVPSGTRVTVQSPWRAGPRDGTVEQDVAITFPPFGGGGDSSRYTGVLSAMPSDTGAIVLLSGSHGDDRVRRGALTRDGQRCLFVRGLESPTDSLVLLLTQAVAGVR